ncbi:DUF2239 family protein [Pseudomonas sp. SID14000]|uniref:DUF2239 family protein n=1 Tax=Pseudomonas sp. SID14000 TaxID=1986221 RepID=UPI000B3CC1E6|nr:DUF2239 family protein [Pseudomonas sp. SID14000]
MNATEHTSWIAFSKSKCIASGAPREVATDVKRIADSQASDNVLVFDAKTSQRIEIDLRGSLSAVLRRLPAAQQQEPAPDSALPTSSGRTAGRPRLGVIAREVTLLPRHWEWLATQPGGASVALRKLVEQGLRSSKEADRLRQAQEAAYRFMEVMAGDSPGFEEATRALFAGDLGRLQQLVSKWPRDVRNHVLTLAAVTVPNSP